MKLKGKKIGNYYTLPRKITFRYGLGLVQKRAWPKNTRMTFMGYGSYMLVGNYAKFTGPDGKLYWILYREAKLPNGRNYVLKKAHKVELTSTSKGEPATLDAKTTIAIVRTWRGGDNASQGYVIDILDGPYAPQSALVSPSVEDAV